MWYEMSCEGHFNHELNEELIDFNFATAQVADIDENVTEITLISLK